MDLDRQMLVRGLITAAAVVVPLAILYVRKFRVDPVKEARLCALLRAKQIAQARALLSSMGRISGSLQLLNLVAATGEPGLLEMLMEKMPTWREAFGSMERDGMETTPLHVAAVHGFVPVAALFLEKGIDANTTDLSLQTPLFLAASGGHSDMAQLLLKYGGNVFHQTNTLKTAVHYAAHLGQDDVVRVFAAHLAGRTGTEEASSTSTNNDEAVESDEEVLSVDGLARLMRLKDISGYTALHVACLGGSVSTVKLLISYDADVNKAATDGSTSLHLATQPQNKNTSPELIRALLEAGADPMVMTTFGSTPLHLACSAGRAAIVREILACASALGKAKELLTAQDNDGMLPIHSLCHAVTNKRHESEASIFECCDVLLQSGADVNGLDYGDASVLHYLMSVPPTALSAAVASKFVSAGAKVTLENGQGWTPLHALLSHRKPTLEDTPESLALESLFREAAAREDQNFLTSFDPKKKRDLSNRLYLLRRGPHNRIPLATRQAVLNGEFNVAGIAHYIQRIIAEKGHMNIVVLAGAGTSVSAGIPDFRSPKTGLYADERYQNAFSWDRLNEDPELFFDLMKRVFYPIIKGDIKPTPTHHFFKLLHDKGLLRRLYTQNVDTLDRRVGIPLDKIVEAHGTLATASCASGCRTPVNMDHFWEMVGEDKVPRCSCGGLIVPDVVFFGQGMPAEFIKRKDEDLAKADLIIVLGTSLVVYPFAGMVNQVSLLTPRLLINKTRSGPFQHIGTNQDESDISNYRDVAHLSTCDEGVEELCKHLGWLEELKTLSSSSSR